MGEPNRCIFDNVRKIMKIEIPTFNFQNIAVKRPSFLQQIEVLFRTHPLVGILGPRQCGKTTLARDYITALPQRHLPILCLRMPTAWFGAGPM